MAVEEPLDIRITTQDSNVAVTHNVAVTMRTPGQDLELALGFLFSESLITGKADVDWEQTRRAADDADCNRITVALQPEIAFDPEHLSRHVFTSSSCGVCGKISRENIVAKCPRATSEPPIFSASIFGDLPHRLRENQAGFKQTGGLHAAASFDRSGSVGPIYEDVGRHNALDKLVGDFLRRGSLSHTTGLLLSGRISFELVQKAGLAGFKVIAAIGAPSSLAVELARDLDITLIGFLKTTSMNIYHGADRIRSA
nr:formate dehydrogenase accessory sulfurtransferase FdhD [Acanthopleuribacter pedis]